MILWSARYHDRERFRMGVVSLMSGGEMADEIRREGVQVHELAQARGRFTPSSFVRFMKVVNMFDPQILQGHMFHSNILVRLAGSLRRRTGVLSTRHIDLTGPARRFLNSATGFLNDGTLVFSPRVLEAEERENILRRPVRLIRYGIEIPPGEDGAGQGGEPAREGIRAELGIGPDVFVWAAVGRLTRQKGFTDLIEAFAALKGSGDSPVLLIVGDGEDREMLGTMARARGVGPRVIFTGSRRDIDELLRASDAFALSSLWEGGPLVILEAMAAGLPVVATRVGDAPDMVLEGRTGIIVDPGDPRQLTEAMDRVMAGGEDMHVWGQRARQRVGSDYDFRRLQGQMEDYYLELAAQRKGN
jgi:glycosyltransferase involved in cell wall biosynthesis